MAPLTVLAGPNSSGKSSLMQPLLLLKQTIEAPYDPGSLLIDGPNVRFTAANQLLARNPRGVGGDSFSVDVEIDASATVGVTYKKSLKRPIEAVEMRVRTREAAELRFRPGMPHEEILTVLPENLRPLANMFGQNDRPVTWQVGRNRGFLRLQLTTGIDKTPLQLSGEFLQINEQRLLLNHIRRIIHVPGLRGEPQRTQKTTAVGTEFPGTFESYVASVLNHWKENEQGKLRRVGTGLEKLGLTWGVDAARVDDTRVEIRVGRLTHKSKSRERDMVNIADVGFGVSQVLPVLVALQAAGRGQLVYVEQPELHLHPRAQFALAEILSDAIERGIRVTIETHSSLLLLGIQTLVAEGRIAHDAVSLNWFSRDVDGITKVTSAELDGSGRFGNWPEDFDIVNLEAESRFLDAVDAHETKKVSSP